MIHPIPSGTRDVLPDEMRELRAILAAAHRVFDDAGYGEVATPALEYEDTLAIGGVGGTLPAYRLFDEQGNVLTLRSDMTVPIARLVATRFATAEPPLRLCYVAHAYRGVKPQRGQSREFLQAGIELIGAPAPSGTAEALTLLCDTLDAVGLRSYRIGLGDVALYQALLDGHGVAGEGRERILHELVTRDFVGLEREVDALRLTDAHAVQQLKRIPQLRGGPELLAQLDGAAAEAAEGLRGVHELLEPRVAERVIFDLGLVRDLGYYTGAIFQVYDPKLGAPLGGGGRYDDLIGRFGRPLPAVGWALNVERLHIALAGEEADSSPGGSDSVGRTRLGARSSGSEGSR
ncbi:ATP phosphoribosyltransferase regulatory subunit [Conexibacter woesei]|uniref:ATP phosphoribosyltransferase regulatory subunit n=1 Tax=Conexibacter woesei (strain DSM 14684 / CCUG 47730 / CIP 108061 / JCM 11494 / NBRC 100937 / ID131577) TaxID=469383 RepID=D3F091_CONWI|nr:ATP phosphoribosyltransferase regulatory subunit [Conexibacter woesei]ADB51951.1 histidyl-tRNA synthetase 2 [Conexibacter woesei DSM 14684]